MIAFVLGSAACLASDLEAAIALVPAPDTVIAVNAASTIWRGPLPHLATMHPDKAPGWLTERARRGLPAPEVLWRPPGSVRPADGLLWREADAWGGSSGLFGVSVARTIGATRIMLCGVPIDAQPHFTDAHPWRDAIRYRHAWVSRKRFLVEYVRSMSGWTAELLGRPDREWLGAVSSAPTGAAQH